MPRKFASVPKGLTVFVYVEGEAALASASRAGVAGWLIFFCLMSSAWMKGHRRSALPIGSLGSAAICSIISEMC